MTEFIKCTTAAIHIYSKPNKNYCLCQMKEAFCLPNSKIIYEISTTLQNFINLKCQSATNWMCFKGYLRNGKDPCLSSSGNCISCYGKMLSSSHRSAEPAEMITNYCFDHQIKTYRWPKNLRNLTVHITIKLVEKWIMSVTV